LCDSAKVTTKSLLRKFLLQNLDELIEALVAARKCLRNSVSQSELPGRLFQKAYSQAHVEARCAVAL
jgi:hypothetical protein